MKHFIILCTIIAASAVHGALPPGLRVKFPVFTAIPRTETEATAAGWVSVPRPSGSPLPSLKLLCPADDFTLGILVDDLGYISGVQVALPVAGFTNPVNDMDSLGYKRWSAPAPRGGQAAEYYTTYQLFISQATLASSASERNALRANNATLYDGGVWLPNIDGSLTKITTEANLASIWDRQGCVARMGQHYMYNTRTDGDCNQLYPWFLIFSEGNLIATGFNAFGSLATASQGARNWPERPTAAITSRTTPFAPQCVYDLADSNQVVTLHVYYVDTPSDISCPA